jgi:hypothetical protein
VLPSHRSCRAVKLTHGFNVQMDGAALLRFGWVSRSVMFGTDTALITVEPA